MVWGFKKWRYAVGKYKKLFSTIKPSRYFTLHCAILPENPSMHRLHSNAYALLQRRYNPNKLWVDMLALSTRDMQVMYTTLLPPMVDTLSLSTHDFSRGAWIDSCITKPF